MEIFWGSLKTRKPDQSANRSIESVFIDHTDSQNKLPADNVPNLYQSGSTNSGLNRPNSENFFAPWSSNGFTITSHSRLDNREELFTKLGITTQSRTEFPDYCLMLLAFQKWSSACFSQFKGDWSVSIWDSITGNLYLAVDFMSTYSIYFSCESDQFVYSNQIQKLIHLKQDDIAPNAFYLAERLLIHRTRKAHTALDNVFFVPPGCFMVINDEGGLDTHRYWKGDTIAPIGGMPHTEIIEQFLHHYKTAVQRRIPDNGQIYTHLSGGLDSGSVTWLATTILRNQHRKTVACTATEAYDTSRFFGDKGNEYQFATLSAQVCHNLEHKRFDFIGESVVDAIELYVRSSLSIPHGIAGCYWIDGISKYASSHGCTTLLVGQVGNATVTWRGIGTKQSLQYHVNRISDRLKLKLYLGNSTVLKATNIPGAFYPESVKRFANKDWLESLRVKDLLERDRDPIDDVRLEGVHPIRMDQLNLRASFIGQFWEFFSQKHGFNHWDPTADQDLVEFGLRIPERMYYRDGTRFIWKEAFKGKLPNEVVYKKTKGLQNSDWLFRLANESDRLYTLLQSIPPNHAFRSYFDTEELLRFAKEELLPVISGKAMPKPETLGTFTRSLGMYFFLDEIDKINQKKSTVLENL